MGITKVVYVELRPSSFSKFGNFYNTLSVAPETGDTIEGPFHVNEKLVVSGDPVFKGKTTSKKNIQGGKPKFYGGYESGVDVALQFDTASTAYYAATNGVILKDTLNLGYPIDVKLYFDSTGSVTYSSMINNDGIWSTPQTVSLSAFAPNGLIYVEEGNIWTKGVLKGKVTIVATSRGNSNYGKVFLEDDLVYYDNPLGNHLSTDLLGIVAENNIMVLANAQTLGSDLTTHAVMFALNGTISLESPLLTQNYFGKWNILGSMIANTNVATVIGTPKKGLKIHQKYDSRLLTYLPPYFPYTKQYEVVSWLE
jgi:hypothetical protein